MDKSLPVIKTAASACGILAMAMTAKDRNPKYMETSEAGPAALVLC